MPNYVMVPNESPRIDDADVLTRIRSEFREMPGLQLTPAQAARLWNIDRVTACALLERLLALGFLTRTKTGAYASRVD